MNIHRQGKILYVVAREKPRAPSQVAPLSLASAFFLSTSMVQALHLPTRATTGDSSQYEYRIIKAVDGVHKTALERKKFLSTGETLVLLKGKEWGIMNKISSFPAGAGSKKFSLLADPDLDPVDYSPPQPSDLCREASKGKRRGS